MDLPLSHLQTKSLKIGLDADQLRALTPAGLLSINTLVSDSDRARYAAGECAQIFTAADDSPLVAPGLPPYAELEFIAPPCSTTLVQLWHLC